MITKAKVYFLNRFVQTLTNKQDGVINYGSDNLLPNKNLKDIAASGAARRAVGTLSRYIRGNGWLEGGDTPVGKMTAEQLLSVAAEQVAYFGGISFLVRYNLKGDKSVSPIAFQGVRRKLDGSFDYNAKLGTKEFKKAETINYPKFEKDIANYEGGKPPAAGALLYYFNESVENPHYPVTWYNAGIEDIKTSAELSLLDLEMVLNGFMPSSILTTMEFDDKTKDEADKTEYERFVDVLRQFTGKEKDPKTGLSGRMSLLHIMVKSINERPDLQTFDTKAITDASIAKRDAINREVCRLFGVHPVLCGYSDAAILGNQQAIQNASNELIKSVKDQQEVVERAFSDLFGNYKINAFKIVENIPEQVWEKLTTTEIREVAGYKPITDGTNNEE